MPKRKTAASPRSTPDQFATTCWTQVLASRGDSTEAAAALKCLCEDYYEPIVAFIRRSEGSPDDARDLAHAFFAHVLDGHAFDGAAPDRGRFRSYLLGAAKHFLSQQWTKARRQRRGGDATILPIDDNSELTSESRSPDAEFDRRWATTVLNRALDVLEQDCEAAGDGELFMELRPWLTGDTAHGDQAELATRLGMEPNTLKSHVSRLRKRFRHWVREEVGRTLENPALIDDEMQALLAALRKR